MALIHQKTGSTCLICEDENKNGITIHKTRRQTHRLCLTCAIYHLTPIIDIMIENFRKNIRGKIYIKCPGSIHSKFRNHCKKEVDIYLLTFPDEKHPLNTKIGMIKYLMCNPYAQVCKNGDCNEVTIVHGNFRDIMCAMCKTSWCNRCNVSPYHNDMSCGEYAIQQDCTENGQLLKKKMALGFIKTCPQCGIAIERPAGCNKMFCEGCRTYWCWICNNIITDHDPYNHYRMGECKDKLWKETNQDEEYN